MLKVGDKVRLSAQGIRWWASYSDTLSNNPVNVEGVITVVIVGNMPYRVQWPEGSNSYHEGDLELVSLETTIDAWLKEDALC